VEVEEARVALGREEAEEWEAALAEAEEEAVEDMGVEDRQRVEPQVPLLLKSISILTR
jgi:hypothetical protein